MNVLPAGETAVELDRFFFIEQNSKWLAEWRMFTLKQLVGKTLAIKDKVKNDNSP